MHQLKRRLNLARLQLNKNIYLVKHELKARIVCGLFLFLAVLFVNNFSVRTLVIDFEQINSSQLKVEIASWFYFW